MSTGKASAIIASGTIVSRVLGFLKATMLAAAIGQTGSAAAGAFGLANQLPNNVYALVAGGVMSAVLVPQIIRASKGADGGESYVSKILTLGGTVFLILTAIATIIAPWLVDLYSITASNGGAGFSLEQRALAIGLAYWCMPQILFYAIYTLLGEIYNARSKFGPYTWAPVANNVIGIIGLAVFMVVFGEAETNKFLPVWNEDRITALGFITTGAVAVQALVLVLFFRRTGMRFRLDFGWRGVGLRATGKSALWLFGIVIIGQLKGIAQSRVATLGTETNILTMQNAWYIFSLPHSIVAVSIAIAFFTQMSHHAAAGDVEKIRSDLSSALRSVGMLTSIAAVAIAVVAPPVGRLFEQGFEQSLAMSWVIWALLICLVAYSAEYVIQRVFFALGDTRTAFVYACFGMLLTFSLLWWASSLPTDWIIAGTALAVSIANLISAAAWVVLVRRKIGPFGLRVIVRRHLQYALYALFAGAAGAGVVALLGGYVPGGFGTFNKPAALMTSGLAGVAMAAVYFGLLFATKNPDFRATVDILTARLRRRRD